MTMSLNIITRQHAVLKSKQMNLSCRIYEHSQPWNMIIIHEVNICNNHNCSTSLVVKLELSKMQWSLRPSSDATLHMSRIECKWDKSFVLPYWHSIRLMWSTASEPGLRLIKKRDAETLTVGEGKSQSRKRE